MKPNAEDCEWLFYNANMLFWVCQEKILHEDAHNKLRVWNRISKPRRLCYILIRMNAPVGDIGNLWPSYAFSVSTLLLKFLLLRETGTLSIAVPNRMLNCCVCFGLSTWLQNAELFVELLQLWSNISTSYFFVVIHQKGYKTEKNEGLTVFVW